MIKIKDTIFNENEIVYIMEYSEKELQVMFKDNNDIYVEATFEDIEWNYDKEIIRKALDNDIDLRIKIQELEEKNKTFEDYNFDLNNQLDKLEDRIKEFEEENKILKESLGEMTKRNVKASVYIEEHSLNLNGESEWDLYIEEVKDLYKILKGEENEK